MAISAQEARNLLQQMDTISTPTLPTAQTTSPTVSPGISAAEASQLLEKQGIDPTGGLVGQLRHPVDYMGGLTRDVLMTPVRATQVGVGAGQELQRLGLNIPGVRPALAKVATLMTRPFGGRGVTAEQVQPVEAISPETRQAQVGKLLADVGAYAYPIGRAGMIGRGIAEAGEGLAAKFAPTLFRQVAALGTGAALADPGHRGYGAIQTQAMELLPEIFAGGAKLMPRGLPKPLLGFKGQLAKLIERTDAATEKETKGLYKTSFQGTDHITPELNLETQNNFNEIKNTTTPRSKIRKAISRYEEGDQTLNKLHRLRSDLGKEANKLDLKRVKDGYLSGADEDTEDLLQETRRNISSDLKKHFDQLSPEKNAQYQKAQQYFANNRAPFREYSSIKKLLSPKRVVSPRLYTDLSEDSVPAAQLRNILGVSKPGMEFARMLHSRLVKYPLYGAGIGSSLYGAKKYL